MADSKQIWVVDENVRIYLKWLYVDACIQLYSSILSSTPRYHPILYFILEVPAKRYSNKLAVLPLLIARE